MRALAEQLAAAGTEVLIVSRKVLEAMSPVKTPTGRGRHRAPIVADARDVLGALRRPLSR